MLNPDHPDPQFQRSTWQLLGGTWGFCFAAKGQYREPSEVHFDRSIALPYPPESPRSGVGDQGYHPVVWYRTELALSRAQLGSRRLLLHFGAVDDLASVWVNGVLAGQHRGGFTPFVLDVTDLLAGGEMQSLVVCAEDDPHDLAKPRGKQDWQLEPHGIWYPRTTGIWQPVWYELVPATRLDALRWSCDLASWSLRLSGRALGAEGGGLKLRVRIWAREQLLADAVVWLSEPEFSQEIALAGGAAGAEDARAWLLWSPEHPQLLDAQIELLDTQGQVADQVFSYTALRSVGRDAAHFLLNERPYFLRLALDQGYWPQGLMSASSAELRREVELARMLGFNGVRKHQKSEDPRWLYWCDRIGLLVWSELPSAYAFTARSRERLVSEWLEILRKDRSHPCVVAWVPLNESWGVAQMGSDPAQEDFVRALYYLTRSEDPSRPVSANDGWEQPVTELLTIHDYTPDPDQIRARYRDCSALEHSLEQFRPAGRPLLRGGFSGRDLPVILSEFGGIAFSDGGGWGYSRANDAEDFLRHYQALLQAVRDSEVLAGFCYTQLADTFQERNGLLYEDRSPKADLAALYTATSGRAADPANPLGYSERWLRWLESGPRPSSGAEGELTA